MVGEDAECLALLSLVRPLVFLRSVRCGSCESCSADSFVSKKPENDFDNVSLHRQLRHRLHGEELLTTEPSRDLNNARHSRQ